MSSRRVFAQLLGALIAAAALSGTAGAQSYPATVDRVIDGDTVVMTVSVWPGFVWQGSVRLNGIDTPELRGRCPLEQAQARAARELLVEMLDRAEVITLNAPTYGVYSRRVVGTVEADGVDVSPVLLQSGFARPYSGNGPRQSWCQ